MQVNGPKTSWATYRGTPIEASLGKLCPQDTALVYWELRPGQDPKWVRVVANEPCALASDLVRYENQQPRKRNWRLLFFDSAQGREWEQSGVLMLGVGG